jgi:hypothetical protein
MHHKRGKAKNQRAGCLTCKPHKMNGIDKYKASGYARKKDLQEQDRVNEEAKIIYDVWFGYKNQINVHEHIGDEQSFDEYWDNEKEEQQMSEDIMWENTA